MTTTDRAGSYLDDLARMLGDLDPNERDEVLAGVREHLDATLAEHPDDPTALDAALGRLGPPERIAAEARAGATPTPGTDPAAGGGTPGRSLLTSAALVLTSVAAFVPLLVTGWARLSVLLSVQDAGGGMFGPYPSEVIILSILLAPVWLAGLVCTLASGLPAPTRRDLALAGPVAFGAMVLACVWAEPRVLSGVVSLVLLLVAATWVARSVGRARRASTRPVRERARRGGSR